MTPLADNAAGFAVCFVHSVLDDAGLSPAQFRVFCHVVRRGTCTASAETIAEVCRMHPDTVWAVLRHLENRRMITRKARFGKTTEITITNPDSWLAEPTGNEGAPETKGHPSMSGGGTGNEGVPTHRKIRGTKVIPLKVIPEGNPKKGFSLVSDGDEAPGEKPPPTQSHARAILDHLNAKAGRQFRAIPENLKLIQARLTEVGGDADGIRQMIDRQVARWGKDPKMSEFLRPETLFGKQKFAGYYDDRNLPVLPPGKANAREVTPTFAGGKF